MSFTSELNNSVNLLREIRKSVLARGGDISATAGLVDVPGAVYGIPRDAALGFVSDSGIAYKKTPPQNTQAYAKLAALGGMTYKSENILPFPFYSMEETTVSGVTFSPQPNGTVVVNGKNNSSATVYFYLTSSVTSDAVPVTVGAEYKISGCPAGGSRDKYFIVPRASNFMSDSADIGFGSVYTPPRLGGAKLRLAIGIAPGYTADNLVFKPMVVSSDVTQPFLPFGMWSVIPTGVVSVGVNKLFRPYLYEGEFTRGGLSFNVQSDGTIIVDGTPEYNFSLQLTPAPPYLILTPGKTYTLSGCPEGGGDTTYEMQILTLDLDTNATLVATDTGSGATFTAEGIRDYVNIRFYQGVTVDNLVFKPMLNEGSAVLPFSPYFSSSVVIPDAVKALPGYGMGLNVAYNNRITWSGKTAAYERMVDEYTATGSEAFELRGANAAGVNVFSVSAPFAYKNVIDTPSLSDKYTYGGVVGGIANMLNREDAAGTYLLYFVSGQNALTLYVTSAASTVEEFLAEITGAKFLYALEQSEITDITDSITTDTFLEVQAGGEVTAENINEAAVPWTINFVTKIGE